MAIPRLANLYDRCASASAAADAPGAQAAFLAIVGLRARHAVDAMPVPRAAPTIPMMRYGQPRKIDLLALAAGGRDVAKFEDLSLDDAQRLGGELQRTGLRVVRVGPYSKRFDVAVSGPGAGLYTLIASRGTAAEAVAEAESDRTALGTRRAGLALGYPACCVERFIETEKSEEAAAEGINEAAIRSIAGRGETIPWELNTFSGMSPVGFTPCGAGCEAALAFARRILDAVARLDPSSVAVIREVLRRPILFFRYPLFHVFTDAAPVAARRPVHAVHYRRALANDDGTGFAPALRAWHDHEIGSALDDGDTLLLGDGTLEVRRGSASVARWEIADPRVPLLLRFFD